MDVILEGVVSADLKTVSMLDLRHVVQVRNYLEVGLLLIFWCRSLEVEGLVNRRGV